MERISLFEEYRLVERGENEVNGAWKGAHLLLFFMAFVFGSFCTFCFHILMHLFDDKCVLFPKLQSLTSLHHNVIYDFIPLDKDSPDLLPVDFLNTQWMEKNACYLPMYVPLVSGIFGLVWTTMFLMCSTGSRTLTGLQRPWRILPPVFIFSLAMGGLCVYSSAITHYGLQELCNKLSKVTGSPSCTYTVNVATLAYERRIRGVYQAIKLTIISAWLHTACWLLSALLTVARVLLVVDFQLVRVNAELVGDVDKLLESCEKPIRTILPDVWYNTENDSLKSLPIQLQSKVQFKDTSISTEKDLAIDDIEELYVANSDLFYSTKAMKSELSLLLEERNKIAKIRAYQSVSKQHKFIVKIIYNLVETINLPEIENKFSESSSFDKPPSYQLTITRQYGQEKISSNNRYAPRNNDSENSIDIHDTKEIIKGINLQEKLHMQLIDPPALLSSSIPSTSLLAKKQENIPLFESTLNITDELKKNFEAKLNSQSNAEYPSEISTEEIKIAKKSNLKQIGIQTNKKQKSTKSQKVYIAKSTSTTEEKDKETQLHNIKEDLNKKSVTTRETKEPDKNDQETQTSKKEKQD
ncbi:uncharacterized protein LOC113519836 [Galleria mellonella]|uniref:Uncharacterized protein LOC113519836 n=1 Tax=Galleria mellonella TaxID=7137 RepID=A0A6J1WWT3_GALME|nr:uncharacterized protein LOC113519836 [Galleria mellonella]